MTPAQYFNEIALPTVQEFKKDRQSRRHAYLACIAVFHVMNYLAEARSEKKAKTVQDIVKADLGESFHVVRVVCNSAKHLRLDDKHEIEFRSGDDWSRPAARAGQAIAGLSRIGDQNGDREFQFKNRRYGIYACIRRILISYEKKFPSHFAGCDFSAI
ncbi:MAG: hypothetical protein U1E49_19870 [Hyphomicrobiaceae bacterium]